MKKTFEAIGLFSLICFSFFYTAQISTVVKDNDNIVKQIKEIQEQYKIDPIDAIIDGDSIIPGASGSEIDINASYKKMKKINSFNDNLLVYKKIKPNISVDKMYTKYVISGNKSKKEVALIFTIVDETIDSILSILDDNDVKATFFVDGMWFEQNNQFVIDLIDKGYTIGYMGYFLNYDHQNTDWINAMTTKVANQKHTFCYNLTDDATALNTCSSNKSYTIRPNIVVKENPLIEIKKSINNGSIISIQVNEVTTQQLPLILNYIKSKGYEMITLEELINE